ncbi:c-type cytochrome [Cloacibacterium sp. TD35]|uniref:c-type cytochrome n=1 Tax=Cloacibacterium sp. TD35 TaxID=2976818 RepID=UPI00237EDC4E|nr:cytochrome c [Cloacibacterium sp. TD35]WDT68733.1 cytochrome c [Cloacibacterium sp. TD35]
MRNMKNILKITTILGISVIALNSCGPKDNPPLVYFPDMYFPVAYDPMIKTASKADGHYVSKENEIPAFVNNYGSTLLSPVEGTVPQDKEGILPEDKTPKNVEEYTAFYDESKNVTVSPLNPNNKEKDLARGKKLYEMTCAACHGVGGDGQGPIVQSGAYSGVPNYKDRQITVGSTHYVIVNGRNLMGSYAGQLAPADRWRVAMYVMSAFKADAVAPVAAADATTPQTNTK